MDKNYKYAGKPLTERIAREHIIEIFSGKTGIEKKEIKQAIDETHAARGGILSTNELHPVSNSLNILKKQGLADNPIRGRWTIFSNPDVSPKDPLDLDDVRTLGSGGSSVYFYYYPAYRALAASEGKQVWACGISSVRSQIGTAMPEPPEIKLILKTDDPENLERTLQNVLKFRGKQIENAPERKWFTTSPSEVKEIFKNIMGN